MTPLASCTPPPPTPSTCAGVDPKSVVCEFFRHGQCTKGFKCKYSHDLNVERKSAKIDLFTDQRELGGEGEEVRRACRGMRCGGPLAEVEGSSRDA